MISFVLPFLLLQSVTARPSLREGPSHTHYTRALKNGVKIKTFTPSHTFEVFDRGIERRALTSDLGDDDPRTAVVNFVHTKLSGGSTGLTGNSTNEDDGDLQMISSFKGPNGSLVTWVGQKVNGIPVANTLASVGTNQKGDVTTYTSSFVKLNKTSSFGPGGSYNTKPKLSGSEASASAINLLGGRIDKNRQPHLEFLAVEGGDLKLTQTVRMFLDDGHYVDAYVDAEAGTVEGLVDYTFDLNMRVVPFTAKDISEGYEMLNDVEDFKMSPHGWMASGELQIRRDATLGNNVLATSTDVDFDRASDKDIDNGAVSSSAPGVFDYPVDLKADPTSPGNRAASVANVWYVTNMAHDLLKRYGFTGESFNYEVLSEGGAGGDPVYISTQDKSGRNNAQFASGPDGNFGVMKMFLWDTPNGVMDCGFDNGVILHEMMHGVSNRLTGGGTARCLQSVESRGMGEGWSDALANFVWQTAQPEFKDFTVGSYVSGNPGGIRGHPYSTDFRTNPLTYGDVKGREEVHNIGEIWAQALHNVHASLIRDFGVADDALTNPDGDNGHAVWMHLLIDALALQPCNPSFTDARTAWIQADKNRYGGKHLCSIWFGFARVGLGVDAANLENSFLVPSDCPGQ